MHAIIVVADKKELAKRNDSDEFGESCSCVRDSSVKNARQLIKYLHKNLKFSRDQISTFRNSHYDSGAFLLKSLEFAVNRHKDEDLIIYYSGHGGEDCWGFNNHFNDVIKYLDLMGALSAFNGRLILINECCFAFAIEPYLVKLQGRYLLFGSSRKNKVSTASVCVLGQILEAWSRGRRAYPKVLHTEINRKDSFDVLEMDICSDVRDSSILECLGTHEFYMIKRVYTCHKPSLRRGVSLDYLMFPKAPE